MLKIKRSDLIGVIVLLVFFLLNCIFYTKSQDREIQFLLSKISEIEKMVNEINYKLGME